MSFRKWLARLLVAMLLAALAGGYYLYQRWTDPEAVRATVLRELAARFPNADVELDSARLRLLGGIQLEGLKVRRREAPDEPAILAAPTIVLVHDKQQLTQGKLKIRKIKMKRPRLELVRRDGVWNLSGLISTAPTTDPLPLIECQQGTLVLVDQTPSPSPLPQGGVGRVRGDKLEIRDLSLTLTPVNQQQVQVRAAGTCDLLGEIELHGAANPMTGELSVQVRLPKLVVGPPLLPRLATYAPDAKDHVQGIEGVAEVHGELAYHPHSDPPWSHSVSVHLRQARLGHPKLPVVVEHAEVLARCRRGRVTLEKLEGKVAGATVRADGEFESLSLDADFDARVRIERLNIQKSHYDQLPPVLRKLCREFQPEGVVTFDCDFHRAGGVLSARHQIKPEGLAILYEGFPYLAEGLRGMLDYVDTGREPPVLKVDLKGTAGKRPVRIVGRLFGEGLRPDNDLKSGIELDLGGERLPIDDRVFAALKPYPETLKLVREFEPTGAVSFLAELRRQPQAAGAPEPPFQQHIVLNAHEAGIRYRKFPYRVEQVEGTIEIFPDGGWRFYDCKGRRKGGVFQGVGHGIPTARGTRVSLSIQGTNALLDPEMEAALSGEVKNAWTLIRPSGRVDFLAKVEQLGAAKPELDLHLTARNCNIRLTPFPYLLTGVRGSLHFAKRRVELGRFHAKHGETNVQLERGQVILLPDGGTWTHLRQLWAEPLAIDDDFLAAAPGMLRKVFETLRPDTPIRLVTDLTVEKPGTPSPSPLPQGGEGKVRSSASPRPQGGEGKVRGLPGKYAWDGHVLFSDATIQAGVTLQQVSGLVACWGTHDGKDLNASGNLHLDRTVLFKQPFRDLRGRFEITDESLFLREVYAKLHGGEVYGPIRVEFGKEPVYRVDLTVSQADLEQFSRATLGNSQTRGTASAHLRLAGKGSDLSTMRGQGKLDIEDARLYDVPLIVELLTFLSGKVPSGTAFQEAHAQFSLEGERVSIGRLDLIGEALTLRGEGSMQADATDLNLEMHGLLWSRGMIPLPRLLDQIPPAISKQLMKIRVRGDLGKTRITTEPVPIVTEPLKELWDAMGRRGRQGSGTP